MQVQLKIKFKGFPLAFLTSSQLCKKHPVLPSMDVNLLLVLDNSSTFGSKRTHGQALSHRNLVIAAQSAKSTG